ncbi:O-antigen ligase family protein [Enteractinococcus fodinae]|uniref:O-antigen ligase-related domain-containing protein n=1 Tax=Enteractinococcus fodinae TaxID=684663 RepID=A0ABU2B324_9MICC|nr:O-antigen ligase family protein [Enteractinococcus fodinae]MDR7347997.1 hypothetical protein [Enteractinococcus fodinae]
MYVIRALLVALVLLGGYLGPGSDSYITQPAIIIAAFFLLLEVARHLPKLHSIIPFIILVFGLLSVHRMFSEPLLEYGEQKFVSLWTVIVFSAAIASLISLPRGFIALAVIWVAIGIYLSAASLLNSDSLRAEVFGMNPIWVSRVMSAGFVLLVWLYWTKRIRLVWTIIIGISLFLGIFATGSRGPLVAALSGTAVIILASKITIGKKIWALALGSLGTLVLVKLPWFSESRIVGILAGEIDGGTARKRMWEQSLPVISDHPLGVGYGNWALYTDGFKGFYPHNLFLEVFIEQGAIVGTFFILLVLAILVRCLKTSRHSTIALGVSAWLVAEIVHVSVSGDLKAPIFFFSLALAFLVAARTKTSDGPGKRNPTSSTLQKPLKLVRLGNKQ